MPSLAAQLELEFRSLTACLVRAKLVLTTAGTGVPGSTKRRLEHIRDAMKLLQSEITVKQHSSVFPPSAGKEEWECGAEPLEWAAVCSDSGSMAAPDSLAAEQSRSIAAYASLLLVAVARMGQLDRLITEDNVLAEAAQIEEFDVTWDVILNVGSFLAGWPDGWPQSAFIANAALNTALDRLLAWHTGLLRGGSLLLRFARFKRSGLQMHMLTLQTLAVAAAPLKRLDAVPVGRLPGVMALFPPGYVSRVCCLVVDSVGRASVSASPSPSQAQPVRCTTSRSP